MPPNGRQVALVTGAAGGIGRATVALLRERGFCIVAADLSVAAIPCGVNDFLTLNLDVCDEAAIARGIAQTLQSFGRLDHVVHLAGKAGTGPLSAVSRVDWDDVLAVNLTSAFLIAKAAAEPLAAARGSLTLMASTNGINGGSALSGPAYAVAKAGLINLTRYLAKEWAEKRVRVNALAPGPIATPMVTGRFDAEQLVALQQSVPLGKIGRPEDVAHAIGYLLSDQAQFITGTIMNVSGGLVLD